MSETSNREYWRSPLEELTEQEDPVQDETQNPGAQEGSEDMVIGTPEDDTTWDGPQSFPDTCTIRCQESIIEQFTGQEIDEEALVQEALDNGWYRPGVGTTFEHTGSLLEAHGIPVTQYFGANTFQLANELAQGHKVILSVDAGELWGQEDPVLEEISGIADRDVDHDVVISGIDTTDPNDPRVIVSDPGTGETGASYPMAQFLAAWQDSDFFMAATQEPVPPTAIEMSNFDYEAGHIPEVAGIPYEEFVALPDQTEEFDDLVNRLLTQPFVQAVQPESSQSSVQPASGMPSGEDLNPWDDALGNDPEEVSIAPNPSENPHALVVDPALLDPNVPGPTLNPNLFDPTAPGPTIDPRLLDSNMPGPTLAPGLLDSATPGLTLDPNLLDPNAPGPTLDPYASMPPHLTQMFQDTNELLSESQNLANEARAEDVQPSTGGLVPPNPGISPSIQSFLDGLNLQQQQAARIPELTERALEGDTDAQVELDQINEITQRQTMMLEGSVASQNISNEVAQGEEALQTSNEMHQEIIDSDQAITEAQSVESAAADAVDDPI